MWIMRRIARKIAGETTARSSESVLPPDPTTRRASSINEGPSYRVRRLASMGPGIERSPFSYRRNASGLHPTRRAELRRLRPLLMRAVFRWGVQSSILAATRAGDILPFYPT